MLWYKGALAAAGAGPPAVMTAGVPISSGDDDRTWQTRLEDWREERKQRHTHTPMCIQTYRDTERNTHTCSKMLYLARKAAEINHFTSRAVDVTQTGRCYTSATSLSNWLSWSQRAICHVGEASTPPLIRSREPSTQSHAPESSDLPGAGR